MNSPLSDTRQYSQWNNQTFLLSCHKGVDTIFRAFHDMAGISEVDRMEIVCFQVCNKCTRLVLGVLMIISCHKNIATLITHYSVLTASKYADNCNLSS